MKKILIINVTLNKGGAARVAYDLFKDLGSDFDIFFAYGRGNKTTDGKTFYFGNKIEMYIHIFLVRFLGLEGFGSYFSTIKLINFIKREKFDLINIHILHGYYVNFFMLINFLKESKIPIVYSLHDEWPITWLPAHSLGCNHCKTGLGKCINTYSYPKNYFPIFFKFMLDRKKTAFSKILNITLVCPSIWLKNSIENSFLNTFKIKVIGNGIDTDIFKPAIDKRALRIKYNLPIDKKIILFSASNLNDKNKGIGHIIDTAKLLNDKSLFFVGVGNGEIKGVPNLITLGYIYDKKKLAEIYSLSDIFCFASSVETFLLSVAEALSCGIPVIGFDLPVVRELVNNNVGILTKNDSKSLCEEICKLERDNNRMFTLGQEGRKLIIANYSKKTFLEEYRKIYSIY